MKARTYNPESGFGKNKQNLEAFGEKQNDFNTQVEEQLVQILQRLDALSGEIAALSERLSAQEGEQERNITRFGRCAAELDQIHQDVDKVRLTAKLNSNSIDRIMKKADNT